MYEEDVSKNHHGGLKNRELAQKVIRHHANVDNPARCFVRLFKLYLSKINPDASYTIRILLQATSEMA